MKNYIILYFVIFFNSLFDTKAQWIQVKEFSGSVFDVKQNSSKIYCSGDDGIFLSENGGETWKPIGKKLLTYTSFADISFADETMYLMTTSVKNILNSADDFETWNFVYSNEAYYNNFALGATPYNLQKPYYWQKNFLFDNNKFFLATNSYASLFEAQNYLNKKITNINLTDSSFNHFLKFDQTLYAATNSGIYLLNTQDSTWHSKNNGIGEKLVYKLATSNKTLYAATSEGVYKSIDNANNWSEVNTGLGLKNVYSLNVWGDNLIAGTNAGIFFSNNRGDTWSSFNTGLPEEAYIYSVLITDKDVLIGTGSSGVYKRPKADFPFSILAVNKSKFLNDLNIYPNPTEGEININSSAAKNNIMLSVIDLQGRQVLSKFYPNFENEILNLAALQKGIYFLKIEADDLIQYEKILIK